MLLQDICSPELTWTKLIYNGICKLLRFLLLESDDSKDFEASHAASSSRNRFLDALKKKLKEATIFQRERRREIDLIRLSKLPTINEMNAAAAKSMFDLLVLKEKYLQMHLFEDQGIQSLVRRAINTIAYGVLAYRTYPGRPGEWSRMTCKQIQACLKDPEMEYIIIVDHKTKKGGSLGRLLPPDVKFVCEILIEFSTSNGLLFCPTGSGKVCRMDKLALQHCQLYTPNKQGPEPTLMRKFVETITSDKKNFEKAKEMRRRVEEGGMANTVSDLTCGMSGHGPITQKNHYDLNKADPEVHARASKAYIEVFVGPTLAIPTEADLLANPQRTSDQILEEFAQAISKSGANIPDESSDDEEDDDDDNDDEEDNDEDAAPKDKKDKKEKNEKIEEKTKDKHYEIKENKRPLITPGVASGSAGVPDQSSKRTRRTHGNPTEQQKKWIYDKCLKAAAGWEMPVGQAPPKVILEPIWQEGILRSAITRKQIKFL